MRILIILFAIIILLLILQFFYRRSPVDLKALGRWLAIVAGGALFLFLLATGRLHWLFGVIAAALTALYRMLPLLRYVPVLRNVYRRYQSGQQTTGGASTAQTSTVQSRFLRMTLNHDSGDMDGEVLEGQFKGQRLQQLSLPQLMSLLNDCQDEQDSFALLTAYLDRMHPQWRDQASSGGSGYDEKQSTTDATGGTMTVAEAYDVLGLNQSASKEQIRAAHRRLMQKLHPDHGGSTYLAAKINLAKDVLLKQG